MEKISSIIPSNKRIESTDMESARPVRPGANTYGAPVGESGSTRTTKTVAVDGRAGVDTYKNLMDTRSSKEREHVAAIQALTDSFFMTKTTPKIDAVEPVGIESMPAPQKPAPSVDGNTYVVGQNLSVEA